MQSMRQFVPHLRHVFRSSKPQSCKGWRCFSAEQQSAQGGVDITVESAGRQRFRHVMTWIIPPTLAGVLAWGFLQPDEQPLFSTGSSSHKGPVKGETLVNWSGTHTSKPKLYYQPESQAEVESIVAECQDAKRRLRVVGSALSPNGLSFSDEGMMSMGLLDKVLWVDPDKQKVRVEAGCRVQQVADHLKQQGLSLQNYASIREQQIGGFTQVSAHGTGATIPPVDDMVVSMKLVTPALGTIEVSKDKDPELFHMARVGLGCLGVVTELTLQCVPAHQLVEHKFTANVKEVHKNHARWLRDNRHLRYMWLPYTDSVVVVQCNPAKSDKQVQSLSKVTPKYTPDQRVAPLRELLLAAANVKPAELAGMSATELRDALLVMDPLNKDWVGKVNQAEAEYWKRSSGYRVGWSDEILGFDCGGQQWVLEVAFPIGKYGAVTSSWRSKNTMDLQYMTDLLSEIDAAAIPAHAPIEQRWTASTPSPMSPASSPQPDEVHSWVGVIMYLPTEDEETRSRITAAFKHYTELVEDKVMPKYDAVWHWAKIELPDQPERLAAMRTRLAARYPLTQFNTWRGKLDPNNILSNKVIDELLGQPIVS